MKNLIFVFVATCGLFLITPLQSISGTKNTQDVDLTTTVSLVKSTDAERLISRLNEINAMDISALNSSERKELRKEVRSIQKELKTYSEQPYVEARHGGIYISVGAAIIIGLLLILLL